MISSLCDTLWIITGSQMSKAVFREAETADVAQTRSAQWSRLKNGTNTDFPKTFPPYCGQEEQRFASPFAVSFTCEFLPPAPKMRFEWQPKAASSVTSHLGLQKQRWVGTEQPVLTFSLPCVRPLCCHLHHLGVVGASGSAKHWHIFYPDQQSHLALRKVRSRFQTPITIS